MKDGEDILGLFPDYLRGVWEHTAAQAAFLQEIRLRADGPVLLRLGRRECFLARDGRFGDAVSL